MYLVRSISSLQSIIHNRFLRLYMEQIYQDEKSHSFDPPSPSAPRRTFHQASYFHRFQGHVRLDVKGKT